MNLKLLKSKINKDSKIKITGSKSEANRLLILQALYPNITIDNLSNSDDTSLLKKALSSKEKIIDVHHAGTAMRFLTAYFSIKNGREVILTGSSRMKERPIGILVDALKELSADISYIEKEGFPPLKITGTELTKNKVTLSANVSSQYISALLLIGPSLDNGLELTLDGKITSVPYIKMTLSLLDEIGVKNHFVGNTINVLPFKDNKKFKTMTVESDWSSASYFYSIVALSPIGTTIQLSSYKRNSLQGDSVLVDIYEQFGVSTTFGNNTIQINKTEILDSDVVIQLDLSNAPDIAQTIAVTAFGLGLRCDLTGLHTLKIKETDRLEALRVELSKFGADIKVTKDTLYLESHSKSIIDEVEIQTYNDHRMAMAFAPLSLKTNISINDAHVVSKSYPDFWKDLEYLGILMK